MPCAVKSHNELAGTAEVAVLYFPNEYWFLSEEERVVVNVVMHEILGDTPRTKAYSRYILEALMFMYFGIRMAERANFLPILHCEDVKPSKTSLTNCTPFVQPFLRDKVIIVGKKAIGHVLFAGLAPPNMDMLHGRPVEREGREYLLFNGIEYFLNYMKMSTYGEAGEALNALKKKYLDQISIRSHTILKKWLN